MLCALFIVFFQAEDGIRDATVTGVQTCALPICDKGLFTGLAMPMTIRARPTGAIAMSMQNVASPAISLNPPKRNLLEIGRASCRERVCSTVVEGDITTK